MNIARNIFASATPLHSVGGQTGDDGHSGIFYAIVALIAK